MLSLTVHPGEYITIGDDIVVQILKTGEITRVAIEAPRELAIVRSKLVEEKGEAPGMHPAAAEGEKAPALDLFQTGGSPPV